MNKKMLEMTLLLAGLVLTGSAFADGLFSPYSADYDFERKGIGSAKSTFDLTKQADGSFVYQSVLHPTKIESLVLGDVTQTSTFHVVAGRPQAGSYSYMEKGKHPSQETIQFDWTKKSSATSESGKTTGAPLTADSTDVQLIQLLLASDAAAGKLADSYQVVNHGETVTYSVKTLPDAKLRLQSGNFETKVVVLTDNDKTKGRSITAWLAPTLHYLPVQIQQADKKNTFTLTLLHISFKDEAPAAGAKPAQ